MSKFYVGQKVRCVKEDHDCGVTATVGDILTVSHDYTDSAIFEASHRGVDNLMWMEDRFVAVPDEEITPGDYVVLAEDHYYAPRFSGPVKVVTVLNDDVIVEDRRGWSDLTIGDGEYWSLKPKGLTKVPAPAAETDKVPGIAEQAVDRFKAEVAEIVRAGMEKAARDGKSVLQSYVAQPVLDRLGYRAVLHTEPYVTLEPIPAE